MQRIRVGLTGLAVVLLMILLATAVLTGLGAGGSGNESSLEAGRQGSGDEPLADLGVAPGAPENAAQDALNAQNAVGAAPFNGQTR